MSIASNLTFLFFYIINIHMYFSGHIWLTTFIAIGLCLIITVSETFIPDDWSRCFNQGYKLSLNNHGNRKFSTWISQRINLMNSSPIRTFVIQFLKSSIFIVITPVGSLSFIDVIGSCSGAGRLRNFGISFTVMFWIGVVLFECVTPVVYLTCLGPTSDVFCMYSCECIFPT